MSLYHSPDHYYELDLLKGYLDFCGLLQPLPAKPVDYKIYFCQMDEEKDGLSQGDYELYTDPLGWWLAPDSHAIRNDALLIPLPQPWAEHVLVMRVLDELNR